MEVTSVDDEEEVEHVGSGFMLMIYIFVMLDQCVDEMMSFDRM